MNTENNLDWLSGGGEMGKLIRSMDWSKTSLGPVESWPQSLRTSVSLCLSSTFPINIVWGPDHVQIYNDSYRPICGTLHPASMGSMFKVCWESALPVVGAAFDRGLQGEGTYIENQQMFLDRFGYLEEAFMTFSFGPIREESGKVGGIFHPITESTEKMLSSRRTQIIRDLAFQLGKAKSIPEVYHYATLNSEQYASDLPFLMIYEAQGEDQTVKLVKAVGVQGDVPESIHQIEIQKLSASLIKDAISHLSSGPYPENPTHALLLPIQIAGRETPTLYLVAGVSSRRAIDSGYESFFEMFQSTISTAITNVTAYEEEQRRAEALAQIDAAKTAFFSNVSHEFRTPLTLILGPLEELLSEPHLGLSTHDLDRLKLTHRSALRLLKLVNSLLDFSRIEAGRVQASYEALDLSQLTTDLASVFRSTVEKAGLKFNIHCEQTIQPTEVDREMWEKIVLNLISNAFKFTFEGSVDVNLRYTSTGAELTVKDTGVGIEASELPRMFERFHRIAGTRSRTYEGTGIGLALVQELVRMQGGTITVESEVNVGTAFKVAIPYSHPKTALVRKDSHDSVSLSSARAEAFLNEAGSWASSDSVAKRPRVSKNESLILLADDNADMRDYVSSILSAHWQVITAKDGQEAFDLCLKHKPALVISDVMMPVLDGFGFLQKMRESELKLTPIVLLSARAGQEAKIEGLAAGADDYLVKPFTAKELVSRVDSMLKIKSVHQEASVLLKENADRFRSMFSHATVNIAMMTLDGVILEINDAFLSASGFEKDDVVGKHFSAITYSEDISSNLANLAKLVTGEVRSLEFEKRYLKKNGGFFWVKTSVSSFLGEDHKPLYLIAVSQNIEEIKTTELKYREAVESLEAQKDLREQFVATLTHDMRSPLAAAKMSAQLLQRRPDKPGSVQDLSARIVQSVARADQMISDLLDAQRIRAGEKLPFHFEKAEFNAVVTDVLADLSTIHGDRILFSPIEAIQGSWALNEIKRVIENLVNNGIKYGDPHAPITVSVVRSGKDVKLSVHNAGNPISESDQATIFELYKRSVSAESGKQKGWGLGLTLVKGVAESHGGSITVKSDAEEGTIFTLSLPVDSSEV